MSLSFNLPPDLEVTALRNAEGARALISHHGAHLLSFVPPQGEEVLYMSEASGFGEGAAIRGGVPIIFPQFAERGPGRRHGFARTALWRRESVTQDGSGALFVLANEDLAPGSFPHPFELRYQVELRSRVAVLYLTVLNRGSEEWSFNAALHSYFQVADIGAVTLHGLQGLPYIDQAAGGAAATQAEEYLRFDGEVDRIYSGAKGLWLGGDAVHDLVIAHSGFTDTVVWNPGPGKAAALKDLAPGGERRFACVEAGAILQPVALSPGASWTGLQVITADPERRSGAE